MTTSPDQVPAPPFTEHLTQHLTPFLPASTVSNVAQTPHCAAAYALAAAHLPAPLLRHSIRTFLHAARHTLPSPTQIPTPTTTQASSASASASMTMTPLLYTASLLHDLGASPSHAAAHAPHRFEVAGADAAHALLRAHDVPAPDADAAWRAVALHTSAGIAERMGDPVAAVRAGVVADFGGVAGAVPEEEEERKRVAELFERVLPRGEVEVCLGEAVVRQVEGFGGVVERRVKAPAASWPGVLVAARERFPDFHGVNPAF